MTNAEFRLWGRLRRPGVGGLKFRRQAPIGPYIADFFCAERRLIVEIDGGQHGHEQGVTRDAVRTAWLSANGYRVVRFWNREIVENVDGVCLAILAAANEPPPQNR